VSDEEAILITGTENLDAAVDALLKTPNPYSPSLWAKKEPY